jgi:Skp family chaperone for outer membrane proteins
MIHLATRSNQKVTWLLVAVFVALAVGLVGLGAIRAANRSPEAVSGGQEGAPANLGKAPQSDAYPQQYQAKIEATVRKMMAEIKASQEQANAAAAEHQRAAQERLDSLAGKYEARLQTMQTATTPPATGNASTDAAAPQAQAQRMTMHTMGQPVHAKTPGPQPFLGSPNEVAPVEAPSSGPDAGAFAQAQSAALVIPEDGFVKGRLLNGVVAQQGGEFRYTHIKLQGDYTSANNFRQNVDGCVVRGQAYAAYAEGRIMVKPIQLTCTLPNKRTRSWATAGYVVDVSDGIEGIAATIVPNQGLRVAAAGAAAGIEKLGSIVSQLESTQVYSPSTGQIASAVTGNKPRALAGGVVQGVGAGLREEVQGYFDLYKPTVQVGGGGWVTVFLHTESELPEGGEAISTVQSANRGKASR